MARPSALRAFAAFAPHPHDDQARAWQQALALLRSRAHRTGALGLLYHLSLERPHRLLFLGAAGALPPLLLAAGDLRAAPELAALAINLSLDEALGAVRRWAGERVQRVAKQAVHHSNSMCSTP